MSELAGMLGGAGSAASGVGSLISSISNLLPTSTTTKFSGGTNTQTSQTNFDEAGIKRMLDLILQSNEGLQAVAGGEKQAGIFNSSTNELLVNNLLSQAAGEVSRLTAPTVTTAVAGPTTTKAKSSKCFITTAICQSSGKSDDCAELQILREFRDKYVFQNHWELLYEYYCDAPKIVDGIAAKEDASTIWESFRTGYLTKALDAIQDGDYAGALAAYRSLYQEAKFIAGV